MKNTADDIVPVSMHLKLVAKVALITSVTSTLVLIFIILFVGGDGGDSYFETLQSHRLTQSSLGTAMLLAGLLLIGFVATATWIISLYASFRVAGPLFRFCRDLELSPITDRPIGIRKEDYLQEVSQELLDTVSTLRGHYTELEGVVDKVAAAYEDPGQENLTELLDDLKALEGRVSC